MLNDKLVRNAEPAAAPYRLADERGMYLEVHPNGSKYWRLKYRIGSGDKARERRLALGVFPAVSLKAARGRRDEARVHIQNGIDPGEKKRVAKVAGTAGLDSFEAVGREWFAKRSAGWVVGHSSKVLGRLENDVFPWLGDKSIASLDAPTILEVLRRVEARGANETAHRCLQYTSRICRYAVATGRLKRDPTADLRGEALVPVDNSRHFETITDPAGIGALMRAINGYTGSLVTRCALKLAPLTIVRPGELRKAEWSEIDLAAAEWRIAPEKMKMRRPHLVPLSTQAVAVLTELKPLTGAGRYVFPNGRTPDRPMSENAVLAALRNMGYEQGQMTGHGFRSMACTLLNEQGWDADAIERQLAHVERSAVRAAYDRAEHLIERRRMMQGWADYLDGLRFGSPLAKAA